jgi:hypothetical protein
MKITKRQLRKIIRESGIKRSLVSIPEELTAAGLTAEEVNWVEKEWTMGAQDLYGNEVVFDKLFNYYMDIEEMPYEVAKARTATPDEWIAERWEDLEDVGMGF